MNKSKANMQRAVAVTTPAYQQHSAAVVETLPEGYPEIIEGVEEAFDIVEESSWGSFPASDAPGWIFTQIGSEPSNAGLRIHQKPENARKRAQ